MMLAAIAGIIVASEVTPPNATSFQKSPAVARSWMCANSAARFFDTSAIARTASGVTVKSARSSLITLAALSSAPTPLNTL